MTKVRVGDIADKCPSCGGNIMEHLLVAGPDQTDYYECIEELLIQHAEQGDEIAIASMAYIERLKDEAGKRGSMGSDNTPSFQVE